MVEHIERVGFKAYLETLFNGELLGQTHIEAHLERTSEKVSAGSARRGTRTHRIRRHRTEVHRSYQAREIAVQNRLALSTGVPGIDTERALQFRLPGRHARFERHDGIPDIVARAEVHACHRTREIIDAVRLAALGHGLSADYPAVDHIPKAWLLTKVRNRVAVVHEKNVRLIEVRRSIVGMGS